MGGLEPSMQGKAGHPTCAGGSRLGGEGSEVTGWSGCGEAAPRMVACFLVFAVGRKGSPFRAHTGEDRSWFGRKADVLHFGTTEFEVAGEMRVQWHAAPRGRREVHAEEKAVEAVSSETEY